MKKITTYLERLSVREGFSNEPMVPLSPFGFRLAPLEDMAIYTGGEIFVRELVANKLLKVEKTLVKDNLHLLVVYGYRHPKIQERYFLEIIEKLRKSQNLPDEELRILADEFVAIPEVAGHPTGGAVDVTLLDAFGNQIDMGTPIINFDEPEKIPTFSNLITDDQKKYRMILRRAMMSQDFVPFNGEWWHFSYGDREWAFWKKQPISIYNQIFFTAF